MKRAWTVASALIYGVLAAFRPSAAQLSDTFTNWVDHPAIAYHSAPATDPVAQLNRQLQDGRAHLTYDGPSGYLRSTLDALHVPVESQVAVFAKDSVQQRRIALANPRTIFFNDALAVGWVRGGFIELAAQDPTQGVIFYTLEDAETALPQFTRQDNCLSCHYSYASTGVPGMLLRSAGQFTVDHSVPLADRWGGWYVTGQHGSIRHLGNVAVDRLEEARTAETSNWTSFDGKFDTTGYLSTHSDIVALLVFEHQMHGMNLLSRIGWETRVADYQRRHGRVMPDEPQGTTDETPVSLDAAAREVVDYLLFIDEAPLTDQIHGSSGFTERFQAEGPRDRQGRSLRDLDLHTRLMRYPCSYLIYTDQFDHLPILAKQAIYRRLHDVLAEENRNPRYARLSAGDRVAIREILTDTKPDFSAYP